VNDGGFIRASLHLAPVGGLDAPGFTGVRLVVRGNGQPNNQHLKTGETALPRQACRTSFDTTTDWREVGLPFDGLRPHRLAATLDIVRLRSLGIVAIGRAMSDDLCVPEIGLY
jgi:hypothetical protein